MLSVLLACCYIAPVNLRFYPRSKYKMIMFHYVMMKHILCALTIVMLTHSSPITKSKETNSCLSDCQRRGYTGALTNSTSCTCASIRTTKEVNVHAPQCECTPGCNTVCGWEGCSPIGECSCSGCWCPFCPKDKFVAHQLNRTIATTISIN